MNCRNCNSNIDYNYLSNCPECGCELEKDDLPKLDPSMRKVRKKRIWIYRLTNLLYVVSTAFVGMIAGTVVTYAIAAAIYMAVRGPELAPHAHCVEGATVGILSCLGGAFFGSVAGTALAVKRPVLSKLAE